MKMKKPADIIPFPDTVRKRNALRRQLWQRRPAIPEGYMFLDNRNQKLIKDVLMSNFEGREAVYKFAWQTRKSSPWKPSVT